MNCLNTDLTEASVLLTMGPGFTVLVTAAHSLLLWEKCTTVSSWHGAMVICIVPAALFLGVLLEGVLLSSCWVGQEAVFSVVQVETSHFCFLQASGPQAHHRHS